MSLILLIMGIYLMLDGDHPFIGIFLIVAAILC